ncbi:MAG: TetR/AcrR family transcriptional regulator [Proteobacteria bacterium]|nr:TetR/AcrR family transcriptional regulator [Pseudomonadota bacterium]
MNRKREQTRKRLLAQAAEEFAKKGFTRTNINEVSVNAGFGKGTIYNYFSNKAELFLSVFRETMDDVTNQISEAIDGIDSPVEKVRVALVTDFEYFDRNRALVSVILRESYSADRDNQQLYLEAAAPVFEVFSQIIMEGIESGDFSKETDPFWSTLMLIGMCENLILTQNVLGPEMGTPKEMAEKVYKTFLYGIQNNPPKGE